MTSARCALKSRSGERPGTAGATRRTARTGAPRNHLAARPLVSYAFCMLPMKAVVKAGRLVVDEPTELAEGEVVELVSLADVLKNGGDYLDDEERARLHGSLERGLDDVRAGRTVDARALVNELSAGAAVR